MEFVICFRVVRKRYTRQQRRPVQGKNNLFYRAAMNPQGTQKRGGGWVSYRIVGIRKYVWL